MLLLGAGRPIYGNTPAALKQVSPSRRALDWQLDGLSDEIAIKEIVFMGGYALEEIIALYPSLKFTVVPGWNDHSIIHTLLQAPVSSNRVLVAYSDTIFRKEAVKAMLAAKADVVFGYDSGWQDRYDGRTHDDISAAETVHVKVSSSSFEAEFTGLLVLGEKARSRMAVLGEKKLGNTIPELMRQLEAENLSVEGVDLKGLWAEFNAPGDVARFILGTKAETLARLAPRVKNSIIGSQISFTVKDWFHCKDAILNKIIEEFKSARAVIVRSSSAAEDSWSASQAGRFFSVGHVLASNRIDLALAIDKVIASYSVDASEQDQVLIQEHVSNIRLAGVALTCGLDNGAPYFTLNVDQVSGSTDSVTGGGAGVFRTIIISKDHSDRLAQIDSSLVPVLEAIREIEAILDYGKLDIEFALDENGDVHVLQVRPITVDHEAFEAVPPQSQLDYATQRFIAAQRPAPQIVGRRTIFGDMPDWNPAEILGARPRPLALSLYQRLITDDIWALQRAEFGYRDLRPHPLLTSFMGRPFVDVRASLNSFLPATLDDDIAGRLVDAGIDRLEEYPHFHDKIEFEVALTVWEPGFRERAETLYRGTQISALDIEVLEAALKDLTRQAIKRLDRDTVSLKTLTLRRQALEAQELSPLDTAYALIEDCALFGTPAFAHSARAGFVAMSLLKGLVRIGGLTEARMQTFLQSLNTVARMLRTDRALKIPMEQLVEKYGHLRPGTYDITAEAYHENPALYLSGSTNDDISTDFVPTSKEREAITGMLKELGSEVLPEDFVSYLRRACEMREAAKFEFTRNVSRALDLLGAAGETFGIDRDSLSYMHYSDIQSLRSGSISPEALRATIDAARGDYRNTLLAELPSLLVEAGDFQGFERHKNMPNFVTFESVRGPLHKDLRTPPPAGSIILTPEADPGYDWLFDHKIGGLVTRYGGANSHMAIRAAELCLPAAIGVGEVYYEKILRMTSIELDCGNRTIRELL